MLATNAERRLGQVADLRLQALHQRRQIVVRLRPERVDLLADQRPLGDACARRRHLQRVVLHVVDQVAAPSRRASSSAPRSARRSATTPSRTSSVAGQPCRPPIFAASDWCSGIQRDGQDQRPDHQAQEGREDPESRASTSARIRPARIRTSSRRRGESSFELGIGIVQCAHQVSPSWMVLRYERSPKSSIRSPGVAESS